MWQELSEKNTILIHTSVKLVTRARRGWGAACRDFNPHEREARDELPTTGGTYPCYFNPHEREARDQDLYILVGEGPVF